ncbi:MAG: outer membrane protein assembly factor BamA [Alphaproteobacteria bacterium]
MFNKLLSSRSLSSGRAMLRLLMCSVCVTGLGFSVAASRPAQALEETNQGLIRNIIVKGNQRIEQETVESYLQVKKGDSFDQKTLDISLKNLFATGLFKDVKLSREANNLVVTVEENPIINRLVFEGNSKLDTKDLEAELQLKPRVVFTKNRLQGDLERLLSLYRRAGRYQVKIDPKMVKLDQNRLDLVFEIQEGERTPVREIRFSGNKAFDDSDLRDELETKETAWWRFLSTSDNFDPDRLNYDKEKLRRFYLSKGYADVQVTGANSELATGNGDFFITFTLDEGKRYQYDSVTLSSAIKGVDVAAIKKDVAMPEKGEWYNAGEIEKAIQQITRILQDSNHPFVDVRPEIKRDQASAKISVKFNVTEGERLVVERINITGNNRTRDEVIRRELKLAEGDPLNRSKIKDSEQQIKDLGFFKSVKMKVDDGSAPDRKQISVAVEEQSTGEVQVGAGFSTTQGALVDFRVRERNFLGKGQDLLFSTTLSGKQQEYDVSFTEPYFLNRDLSAGVDLFHVARDQTTQDSFDQQKTGFNLRLGYPLAEHWRQRLLYKLENNDITNVKTTASRFIRDQEGQRVTSAVGQKLSYDHRDSVLDPTSGYLVAWNTEFAGLGGDAKYWKNTVDASYYTPVIADVVFGLSGELGYITGIGQRVSIGDRFFLGGDTFRGFTAGGVGPRDSSTDDSLGGTELARGSAEFSMPLGNPEEMGLKAHAFTDFGTLHNPDLSGTGIEDSSGIRASAGLGVSWRSPVGPLRFDFGFPILKEKYDERQIFRFSFGTRL